VPATLSKLSITLGLSSASIAPTESQFSISSSSSGLLSLIVSCAAVTLRYPRSSAVLNEMAVAGAVAGASMCGGWLGWPGTAMFTINRLGADMALASGPA
jgi:hypothetical protein